MVTHSPAYADYAHRIIHPGTGDLSRLSHREPSPPDGVLTL